MIEALTYDDVLLLPHYSDIRSRSEVNISTDLGNGLELELPIISSPMDTVSEDIMARAISEEGGCAIIHRYNTPEEQAELVGHARVNGAENIGFAAGVGDDGAVPGSAGQPQRASGQRKRRSASGYAPGGTGGSGGAASTWWRGW